MVRLSFLSLAVLPLITGCESDVEDHNTLVIHDLDTSVTARSQWAGTPEGIAVIDFLNADSTTFEILDDEVPLDRRAAGNLIAHRDGGDGLWGTSDDDLYNDLDEVDDVRWVGPAAIDRLVDYVLDQGLVPVEDDFLGTWDGVSFTVTEATQTLDLANTADLEFLDDDLSLDVRAVNSIAAARPVATMDELAGLYYVGRSALTTLKETAAVPQPNGDTFATDLGAAIVDHYNSYETDIVTGGGNTLEQAQAAVSPASVWTVINTEDDPHSYDLSTYHVFAHPDVVFPGSDSIWFGAYDLYTGVLVEVYSVD